jgi:hypothetical protein
VLCRSSLHSGLSLTILYQNTNIVVANIQFCRYTIRKYKDDCLEQDSHLHSTICKINFEAVKLRPAAATRGT